MAIETPARQATEQTSEAPPPAPAESPAGAAPTALSFPLPGADAAYEMASLAFGELGNVRQALPQAAQNIARVRRVLAYREAQLAGSDEVKAGKNEAERKALLLVHCEKDGVWNTAASELLRAERELDELKCRLAQADDQFKLAREVIGLHSSHPNTVFERTVAQ